MRNLSKAVLALVMLAFVSVNAAQAQDITDADLKDYAIILLAQQSITEKISPMVNDLIAKQEGIDGNRYAELNAAAKGNVDKLPADATDFEKQFYSIVQKRVDKKTKAAKTSKQVIKYLGTGRGENVIFAQEKSLSKIEKTILTDEIVVSSKPVSSNINSGISDFSSAVELNKKAEEIAGEILPNDTIDTKSTTKNSKTRKKSKPKARKKSVADKSKTKLTNQKKSNFGKKQKDSPKVKQNIEDEVSETSSSLNETKEGKPQQEKKSRATIGLPQWKPPSR